MTLTIKEALESLSKGETTSVELVTGAIRMADRLDPELGVFIQRYQESSLAAAHASDEARANGEKMGPLAGIPIGIKDIITTAEGPTTAQSLVFDSSSFSGDAVVVARLRAAGAIIMGKLSTMEFAIGTPDFSKPFPIPRNPWNPETWTGGSSSGTGNGVASEMFLGGLGTDTGGSIRLPASTCGITGLKPTYGRVPKSGCAPLGFTLDNIGPMARSAYDCAIMLNTMAGHAPEDAAASHAPTLDYTAGLDGDLTGVRIGVDRLERVYSEDADAEDLGKAFDEFEAELTSRGATVEYLELPHYEEVSTATLILMVCEGFAYHRNNLAARWEDYSQGLRECLGMAPFYTAADIVQAQRVRRVGVKAIETLFATYDVVVSPTMSRGALTFDEVASFWDGAGDAMLTGYWNGTGSPTMSVPAGFNSKGLPLGLQISGKAFDEATVLKVGDAFQQGTDHHLQRAAMLENSLVSAN